MRRFVPSDRSIVVANLRKVNREVNLVLQAVEATPVYLSENQNELDVVDAGNVPQSGISLTNTQPALVLPAFKQILWARAPSDTFLEVDVFPRQPSGGGR